MLCMSALSLLLTIIKLFLMTGAMPTAAPTNTNSVNISEQAAINPQRDYLTTEEVARKEGVTTRTITTWIEQNRIDPPPNKNGRAWEISNNYRLLPQIADNSGH